MKKSFKILTLFTTLLFSLVLLTSCGNKNNTHLKTVKLNEVVRSVFYAPMYVAISQGFFEEEGISIDLSTGQGADKTMQQVLSGTCDIGFCGPEQIVYIYNQGREDYPVLFSQLTKTDGSFLVGREAEENFKWESLKGKTIIGGRPGGVPEMTLEYVLKTHGLTPGEDVEIITNLDFTATAGAFKAGTGDYVALFEPTASTLENDGAASIVSSIGNEAGSISYTCYFATKSYIEKNPETIQSFTNAIYKGQQWVYSHSNEEIADAICEYFPGTDVALITQAVGHYKEIEAYAKVPNLSEDDLSKLMFIIENYDETLIPDRPTYDVIVDTSFADSAVK